MINGRTVLETLILNDNKDIVTAGKIIQNGGLVAFPTETVYGLGASAYSDEAAKKIYEAKGRPSDNPLIVHVWNTEQIKDVAEEISDTAKLVIDKFMPGPITVILKKKACIPSGVTGGLDTVGVRCPINEVAREFIKSAGVPVAAPSANISGKPSPTNSQHVIDDMMGRIDAIIDSGECSVGVESTIVDMTADTPVILRPGGITYTMLKEVVPDIEIDKNILNTVSKDEVPKCPGTKYKHYSPDADVFVVEGEKCAVQAKIKELILNNKDKCVGVLFIYDAVYDDAIMLSAGKNNREYAHNLFKALREFDKLKVDVVFAEFCDDRDYGLAVKNRLYKAAGHKVIHV